MKYKIYSDLRNYLTKNLNILPSQFRVESIKSREGTAILVSLEDESLVNLKGFPILWEGQTIWTKRLTIYAKNNNT